MNQEAIQKLVYHMHSQPEVGEELKAFMARAVENAVRDEKKLANTPFAEMPRKACAANSQIADLVKEYIANVEGINRAKATCDRQLSTLAEDLASGARQFQTRAGEQIAGAFLTIAAIVLASGVVTVVINVLSARLIVRSLRATATMLRDISEGEGDLTRRLIVGGKDEIGEVAHWFNVFAEKLQGIIGRVAADTVSMSSASQELAGTAAQMAGGAEETNNQSATASAAAEQMSASMTGMADATGQVSDKMKVMASAVDQLNSSIGEVAKSAEQAARVAADAAQLTGASNASIGQLGAAAREIGKVIEVIQDIAEQTNLLALNATIEAARAGDAGKGFAVVATEVKELAKQTASATEDIRKRIEHIQGSAETAVETIGSIAGVIDQVNGLSRTIASAVEEQSVTTREIASNVAESATAVQTVATNLAESAAASREITRSIAGVDQAAKQTAEGAARTQASGQGLSRLADQLQSLVGRFKVGDRPSHDPAGASPTAAA